MVAPKALPWARLCNPFGVVGSDPLGAFGPTPITRIPMLSRARALGNVSRGLWNLDRWLSTELACATPFGRLCCGAAFDRRHSKNSEPGWRRVVQTRRVGAMDGANHLCGEVGVERFRINEAVARVGTMGLCPKPRQRAMPFGIPLLEREEKMGIVSLRCLQRGQRSCDQRVP